MWKTICRSRSRGFTVAELLVVFGVLAILLALFLPSLSKVRSRSRDVVSLSNCRQIGVALQLYANQYAGGPPVIYKPIEARYPPDFQEVVVDGVKVGANWFDHEFDYYLALRSFASRSVFFAPGNAPKSADRAEVPDYLLSKCLYTRPEFWNRWTQAGATQWGAQRFDQIAFPSDKGLVYQFWTYGLPGKSLKQQTQDFEGVPAAVLWADSSATIELLPSLHPGEPNFYAHTRPDIGYAATGWPIAATLQGINGRDRGGTYTFPRRQSGSRQPE